MKIGKIEVAISPNLNFLLVFGALMALDWRLGLGFVGVSVLVGFIGWLVKSKLSIDEEFRYAAGFRFVNGAYIPTVLFRGMRSGRKMKTALVLDQCRCANPDEAIVQSSALAKVLNEKPLRSA